MTPMSTPHIAIMLPKLSKYGGVERFAWRLAEALSNEYNVDFICSKQSTQPPANVRVICLGRPYIGKAFKILWFALGAELVRRHNKYDLSIGLGNTIKQDILRISGGPTPIFWEHSRKAYPKGFARSWKMFKRRLAPANWLVLLIERLQISHTKKLIANSYLVRDWLVQAFPGLDTEAIRVIYNEADLAQFSPSTKHEKHLLKKKFNFLNKVVIATVATNFKLKGIQPLVETLPFLPENYILAVAGGRNPAKYQRIARRLGVSDRVRFLGRVDDMVSFYRASDLFILLSFYDACSNAVFEALATGLPVISTHTNGSSAVLPPKNVLHADSTPEDIAVTIQRALRQGQQPAFVSKFDSGISHYIKIVSDMLRTNTKTKSNAY
jgi:UDP-glucose:(heptosyl)LPS alpha-1,3-glucosyltransferase